jgi:cyanophycin synthetase
MNASDVTMLDELDVSAAGLTLIGSSSVMPALRHHAAAGGATCWVANSAIYVIEDGIEHCVIDCGQVAWLHDGNIPFAVQNALLATAIARACGISVPEIAAGLAEHMAQPELMPGSFNVFEVNGGTVVIDRPAASWFLRPAVRAASNLGSGRGITVSGPMAVVTDDDLVEVGRLLGRHSSIVVIHGDWSSERLTLIRNGAAANDVPPIFMHLPNERRAIQQALGMLTPDRVLLVLAEEAPTAVRIVAAEARRDYDAPPSRVGAA